MVASAPLLNAARHEKIKHVFVIVLENEGYNNTFGPNSKAPYLAQTLTSQGTLSLNTTAPGTRAWITTSR
jgi:hypothetical protein